MKSKLKYVLYWKDTEIGKVFENESGKYKYFPDCSKMQEIGEIPISMVGVPQFTWGELPYFFSQRLEKDPECKNECRYITDKFSIRKVS
mgnify:FL=1